MNTFLLFKKITKTVNLDTGLFAYSVILIIVASFFEIAGIGLVIPVLNSILAGGDFLSNLNVPFLGNLIEYLPFHSSLATLVFLIFLIICSVGLSNICLLASVFFASKVLTSFGHSLRTRIFEKYLSFGKAFYDKNELGILISTMINNTSELLGLFSALRGILVNIIMAAAFLLFLFFISWKFTFLTIPLGFIVYYSLNWLVKKLRASSQKQVSASMGLTSYAIDILGNILLVKSYANEAAEYKKFDQKSELVRFHSYNAEKKYGAIPRVSDIVASIGFLVLAIFSIAFLMKEKSFSLGRFLVYFFVLRRFIIYLKPINELKGCMARITPLLEKTLWVFDDSDKAIIENGSIGFSVLKNKIEFRNLSFSYIPERQILKNLNFVIEKGQTVAIVGPTGSGKTTIAYLLCRFYDYQTGSIIIDGEDIRRFSLHSLRKNIAIVSQETLLLNNSIKNNITYGLEKEYSPQELDEICRQAYIYDFIMSLPGKYDTVVGDRGVKFSGGEKQRISIARALLKNADILILDEATSALDTATEELIHKAINNLTKNRTVLVIAHRLSTIKNSNRIMVLEGGEIKEQGGLQELLEKKGKFFHYWESQKFY